MIDCVSAFKMLLEELNRAFPIVTSKARHNVSLDVEKDVLSLSLFTERPENERGAIWLTFHFEEGDLNDIPALVEGIKSMVPNLLKVFESSG